MLLKLQVNLQRERERLEEDSRWIEKHLVSINHSHGKEFVEMKARLI